MMEVKMKSLANTDKFPARIGKEINREMIAWDNEFHEDRKFFMTAWDGFRFHSNFNVCYAHACEVETDENSFVRDVKRADTKTRPMTYEERVEALERKLEKVG